MKRFFINFSQWMSFALRKPGYAARSLVREVFAADEKFLAVTVGSDVRQIRGDLEEPCQDAEICEHFRKSEKVFRESQIVSVDLFAKKVMLQYALVRAVKPKGILETRIANGVSTTNLLLALKKNGLEKVCSFGLGDVAYLPWGWMVPEWLRDRWNLHIGDSRELLAPLDIFIHDSPHTYDHMMFEFEQTFPFLRPGGILIADDVLWNEEFSEFASGIHAPSAGIIRGVGISRKGDG
jgi:hypothetical protein